MWFSSIRSWLQRADRPNPRPSRRPKRTFRPGLEALEDRAVPALMVTNLADDGPGSLRRAIDDANETFSAPDTIVFQPGLTGTISLITSVASSGQLTVTSPLTIIGPGSGLLTITANTLSRIFLFGNGSPAVNNYSLSGVTLTEGTATGSLFGGAIEVESDSLTLNDVVITGNVAQQGGGVFVNPGGFLLMDNCTVSDNRSVGSGAGLFLSQDSTAFIRNCTISGNRTIGGGSTGGGIFYGGGSALAIENSTISGNTSTSEGGGVRVFGRPASIVNSTIVFNTGGRGGGLSVNDRAGPVTLTSTIVANNTSTIGQFPDIDGEVTAVNSLVTNTTGAVFIGGGNNILNVDPRLGPLANNGGPTRTHALLAGSPARNAGFNVAGLAFDQRGPGFARVVSGAPDIGAFEMPPVVAIRVKHVQLRTRVDVVVDGVLRRRFFPFGTFTGKVRVLKADVNGDGLLDVIARATMGGKKLTRTIVMGNIRDGTSNTILVGE